MADMLLFVPRAQLDCRQNLQEFIRMCRYDLTVFGKDLNWDAVSWPKVVNFTVAGAPARGYKDHQILDAEMLPFAKAYVRYSQGMNPTKLINEIKAIRCVTKALLTVKQRADITLVDHVVLDVAAEVASVEYSATSYQCGIAIVKLSKFLNEAKVVSSYLDWHHPFKKPTELNSTSIAAKQKSSDKLPSDHHLNAMAEMFAADLQSPRDRFTTSVFAILMCAPWRISEVQDLPASCLHWEQDSDGIDRLGFRAYAGKGYASDIKYVQSSFVDIAQEAVRRLLELSQEGRKIAKWYELHPDKFYRHENCPNVGETAPLTAVQACEAMGISTNSPKDSLRSFFKAYEPFKKLSESGEPLTLSFLNEYCRSVLPTGWPWLSEERNIRYSDALCCVRWNEFRSDFTPSPVLLFVPGKSLFTTDLNYINGQEKNIWRRHGYKNEDGTEISMTSHQLRHLLNTAAQRGSLGQLDIARWSGRADITQNPTYNHMGHDELVGLAREAGVGKEEAPSGLIAKIAVNAPVTMADLQAIGDAIAHVTPLGFCVHDYSMLPCQKCRDCLNCTEHVCVKGDLVKLQRMREQRALIKQQLERARAEDTAGTFGADRWSQHHLQSYERLDQMIALMESPDLKDGDVIRLTSDQEFSPIKRELAVRTSTPLIVSSPSSEAPDLDEVRTLLGAF